MDFYEQVLIILRHLLNHLNIESPKVLKMVYFTLTAMSKHILANEFIKHVESI